MDQQQKKRFEPPPVIAAPPKQAEPNVIGTLTILFTDKGAIGHKREGVIALEHTICMQRLIADLATECLHHIQEREIAVAQAQQEAERNFLARINILNSQ